MPVKQVRYGAFDRRHPDVQPQPIYCRYPVCQGVLRTPIAAYRVDETAVKPGGLAATWGARCQYLYPTPFAPLDDAAFFGQAEMLTLLLAAGADPGHRNGSGDAALHWTVRYSSSNTAALRVLLDAGVDPNVQGYLGYTALAWSVSRGDHYHAELLLQHGADVAIKSKDGRTVLDIARAGDCRVTRAMIETAVDSQQGVRDSAP